LAGVVKNAYPLAGGWARGRAFLLVSKPSAQRPAAPDDDKKAHDKGAVILTK
jgi:hypothetical protein